MAGLTAERLREALNYDPATGIFIWRIPRGGQFAGVEAGTLHVKGYITIYVDNWAYLAHRLAWLYVTGEWPPQHIDHRDTDRANNRWTNLRLATNGQNLSNRGRQANNTSGFKGVGLDKRNGRWSATIQVDGKQMRLGKFDTASEAHAAYAVAARKHRGEFARVE